MWYVCMLVGVRAYAGSTTVPPHFSTRGLLCFCASCTDVIVCMHHNYTAFLSCMHAAHVPYTERKDVRQRILTHHSLQCGFLWLHTHSTCPMCRKELNVQEEQDNAALKVQCTLRSFYARRRLKKLQEGKAGHCYAGSE